MISVYWLYSIFNLLSLNYPLSPEIVGLFVKVNDIIGLFPDRIW